MNQTILQPPDTCMYYDQASRTGHSTKSSCESPLHHYYFVMFPDPTAHLQPSDPVDPVPLVQLRDPLSRRRVF